MPSWRVWGDVARANARLGDKPALVGPDGAAVSFAAFNNRVNRLNQALAGLGLAQGARVALLSRNRPECLEVVGVAKSGLVVVPLNWRLTAGELAWQLDHCRPEVIVADATHRGVIDSLRPGLGGVREFIGLDGGGDGWLDYRQVLDQAGDGEPDADVAPDDVLCLMYTSGTTGRPKGVALSHGGLLANCRAVIAGLGLGEGDIGVAVMPLFHVGGLWYHLFPAFAAGGTSHLMTEFEPRALLATLAGRRATHVHLVPTMISALLDVPGVETAELGALRLLYYAASAIPGPLLLRAMAVFGREVFLQSYGSTEGGVISVLSPADHARARQPGHERLLGSCGRPCRDLRIVGPAGQPLPAGAIGEIAVAGEATMLGYWDDAEASRLARPDGWLRTGDLGVLDEQGMLTIIDRKSDMIVSGGENVYPREVEDALFHDPDVLEAAVFALPDPHWVERVAAAVVLRPGVTAAPDDIIAGLRRQIAGYKCPKTVFLVDSLPKSGAGKVLRKELRRRFGG